MSEELKEENKETPVEPIEPKAKESAVTKEQAEAMLIKDRKDREALCQQEFSDLLKKHNCGMTVRTVLENNTISHQITISANEALDELIK